MNVTLAHGESQRSVPASFASPRVSTLNNQRASFDVTTDEPFFSEQRQPVVGPTGARDGTRT